jgi:hypothetical protein
MSLALFEILHNRKIRVYSNSSNSSPRAQQVSELFFQTKYYAVNSTVFQASYNFTSEKIKELSLLNICSENKYINMVVTMILLRKYTAVL